MYQDSVAEEPNRCPIDDSPDAICVHRGGRILHVNSAGMALMAAQSGAQLVGHQITEFVHPDSIPSMLVQMAALQDVGDPTPPTGVVMLRCDGIPIAVDVSSVLTIWDGEPAYQVVCRDSPVRSAALVTPHDQAAFASPVGDAIIVTERNGTITSWNPAAESMYGRPSADALGMSVSEAVGTPVDPAAIVAHGGSLYTAHRAADGSALAVRVSAAEAAGGYVLVCADRTMLHRAEQPFRAIVNSLDEGVLIIGMDRRVVFANPTAQRLLGVHLGDLPSTALELPIDLSLYSTDGHLVDPDQRPVLQTLETGAPTAGVFGVDRADGQRVWRSVSSRLLTPDDPHRRAVLVTFTDITAERAARERLAHEATHDSLTGLPNRSYVVTRVTEALESGGYPTLAAVLFIDLDNMKIINDSLGHSAGDEVLRVASRRLRREVRSSDVVGRFGGDEFVALLVGEIARSELDQLARRLHATLAEPVVVDGITVRSGASVGIVAVEPDEARGAAEILRDADIAMYEAKSKGRGRSHHFSDELRDRRRASGRDEPDQAP